MIPKIIHYCWYGNKKLPDLAQQCIASWKKFMPDYEIILWNEQNSPMNDPYMQNAYQEKNWANLSNYTRLFALKQMGGWYFDTDVEVIKIPDLSNYKENCFLCLETKPFEFPYMVNNAVIAVVPNHHFIVQCFNAINERFDGTELANLSSPILTTDELKKIGFKGKASVLGDLRILSNDYFYPTAWFESYDSSFSTKNTICVHYNDISWLSLDLLTHQDLIGLEKNIAKLKFELKLYKLGNISFFELLKMNFRVIKFRILNPFFKLFNCF
jgi:hypothetical protein